MQAFLDSLLETVKTINGYLTDYILIFLLVGTGLFFTVKTKFVQVRCFGEGMKKVFGKFSLRGGRQQGGLSSFQALATAIAAQVGTGNIVGASGAILAGGPGAVFWMWVIAFFGMATIYAEAVLAQKTRVVNENGEVHGGPVYYIKTAFKDRFGKILAGFFAVVIIVALGFFGIMVQSNSIGETFATAFGVKPWIVGIALVIVSGFIFIGGVQRLASVTEKLVPFMAGLYILGGLIIMIAKITDIPDAFALIFKSAFRPDAVIGGSLGMAIKMAISQGAKRGLFSNEAGMGSTPHAHAMAKVAKPHDQGVVAMTGVFIDTFIVLTITALVVILGLYTGNGALAGQITTEELLVAENIAKTNAVQLAFGSVYGTNGGNIFVAICLLFFAYSTIIGWNFFGKLNMEYLFGKKSTKIYTVIALVFIFLGSCLSNNLVWELTDFFNYLMVIPNVIALLALWKIVANSAKNK